MLKNGSDVYLTYEEQSEVLDRLRRIDTRLTTLMLHEGMEIETSPNTIMRALTEALVIIVGEYPREDDRYIFAAKTARKFGLDLGENGE